MQSIIAKHKLMDQAGRGHQQGWRQRCGRLHLRQGGDRAIPSKLTFGTNNAYLLPYVAKLAYRPGRADAASPRMALDEFLLWVNGKRTL